MSQNSETPRTDSKAAETMALDNLEALTEMHRHAEDLETELTRALAERDALKAEVELKQKSIEYACADWADDDTRVKAIAAEFGIKEAHDNHDAFKGVIEIAEEMAALLTEARKDGQRLDWLLDFITQHGGQGIANMPWTVVDPEELMEDRMEVVFDRAAIDAALTPQKPQLSSDKNTQTNNP